MKRYESIKGMRVKLRWGDIVWVQPPDGKCYRGRITLQSKKGRKNWVQVVGKDGEVRSHPEEHVYPIMPR